MYFSSLPFILFFLKEKTAARALQSLPTGIPRGVPVAPRNVEQIARIGNGRARLSRLLER